jgi:hypothetical protein
MDINISGAAGDLFVTVLLRKFPKQTLIYDLGVGMKFFTKNATTK